MATKETRDPKIAAELRLIHEAAKRAEANINRIRAGRGEQPIRLVVNPQLRRTDPNPWTGKHRVPEILVRMLLSGVGVECKTNKERHALMIRDAVVQSGGKPIDDYAASVWSRKLEGFALENCTGLLTQAGYRPVAADTKLSDFVRLIKAGLPQQRPSDRLGKTWGEGIHAVTFFAANEMMYRGVTYNVQWSSKGKKCGPLHGSGKAQGGGFRGGLLKLLKNSVTREEWPAIKQVAHEAGQARAALQVKLRLEATRKQSRSKLQSELDNVFSNLVG